MFCQGLPSSGLSISGTTQEIFVLAGMEDRYGPFLAGTYGRNVVAATGSWSWVAWACAVSGYTPNVVMPIELAFTRMDQ